MPASRHCIAVAFVVATVTIAAPDVGSATTRTDRAVPVPGAHDCVPRKASGRGDARVAWKRLKNPVFAIDHMTKDQTVRLIDGQWHLFFSERLGDDPETTRTGHWTSTDLAAWTPAPPSQSWGSPDITRGVDDEYVITHQIAEPGSTDISRIHATTSTNPDGPWAPPIRLLPGQFEGERVIDAALAHTDRGLFLLFKRGLHDSAVQHVGVAWAASGSVEGPWEYLGEPDLPWSENFELLPIGGTWHVVATTIPIHQPVLFRLAGDPEDAQSWLHWKKVRTFEVPAEAWNRGRTPGITHETANSGSLCDARRLDGYWYLFYAGSTELTEFDGRGHAKIGVARSKDLVRWQVPPGAPPDPAR